MINADNLNIHLPGFSLKNINMEIRHRDFFALIGPTGSGKSVLLEAIMGLVPLSSGKISLSGRDITDIPVEKRKIAMVYQDFALFPHLNVRDNILYGTRYIDSDKKETCKRFEMLVEILGLGKRLKRYPGTLSGGEKQRVSLARALILNPPALLLDEPMSALDPVFHGEIRELLKTIHRDLNITMLMVTHNFSEVLYLANRGAVIKDGAIVQSGNIKDLFERPASLFAARFVGMKNIFELNRKGDDLLLGDHRIKPDQHMMANHDRFAIRPEEISLVSGNGQVPDHVYKGTVKRISCEGAGFDVTLESGPLEFTASWPARQIRAHKIDTGSVIEFGFMTDAVHTLKAS